MPKCIASVCPTGAQCVQKNYDQFEYECGESQLEWYTDQPVAPAAASGNPIIEFFSNIFNEIRDTIAGLFGSNEPSTTLQPRGIMENRALADEWLAATGSGGTVEPMPTGTLDPYATISKSVNKRGGEQTSGAPKVYNIFGHELSISQGMMIPLIIAAAILIIILLKWS